MTMEVVEERVARITENGHRDEGRHPAAGFFEPCRAGDALDVSKNGERLFPIVAKFDERCLASSVLLILRVRQERLTSGIEAHDEAIDLTDEIPQILREAKQDGFGETVLCDVVGDLRIEQMLPGRRAQGLGRDVRCRRRDAGGAGRLLPAHEAAIRRAGKLAEHMKHHAGIVADGIEAQQKVWIDIQRTRHVDALFHEIEGQMLDLLQELLAHILPALLAHVAGRDLQKAVPRLAAPGDGQDIVAGD